MLLTVAAVGQVIHSVAASDAGDDAGPDAADAADEADAADVADVADVAAVVVPAVGWAVLAADVEEPVQPARARIPVARIAADRAELAEAR
jgi:hypothetical protein